MKQREVSRKESMSPDGELNLVMQSDGDIIVTVHQSGVDNIDGKSIASVEFSMSGGGSPRTLKALQSLFLAMEQDNSDLSCINRRGTRNSQKPTN